MSQRIDYAKAAQAPYEAMLGLERALHQGSLPRPLIHLVKLRASQINGCAFCVDMHSREARHDGESERRLYQVAAFEESPLFDEREKAALAWTESVTRLSETHAPDEVWARVHRQFNDNEVAELTWVIAAINAWNRMAVSFRVPPPVEAPRSK